jgi:hypothetical protein
LVCGRLAEFVLAQLSGAHDARRAHRLWKACSKRCPDWRGMPPSEWSLPAWWGRECRLGGGASSSRVNTNGDGGSWSLLSRRSARSRCRTVILSQMEGEHTTPTPACPSCGNPGPSCDEDHVSLGAISIGARPRGVRDANGQALAAVDHTAIVRPLDAPDIRWQARFNPISIALRSPKQILAHIRILFQFRIRIVFSGRKN